MFNKNFDLALITFIYSINIILYFITFSWIIILEKYKCDCSKDWKREFIKYFILVLILYILISIISNFISTPLNSILEYIKYVVYIGELFFIVITFIYIQELIKNKCECSNMMQRDITLVYTIVDGIIIILSLILAFCITVYKALYSSTS